MACLQKTKRVFLCSLVQRRGNMSHIDSSQGSLWVKRWFQSLMNPMLCHILSGDWQHRAGCRLLFATGGTCHSGLLLPCHEWYRRMFVEQLHLFGWSISQFKTSQVYSWSLEIFLTLVKFASLLETSSYVPGRPVLIITDPCQLTLLSGVHSGVKHGVGPVLLGWKQRSYQRDGMAMGIVIIIIMQKVQEIIVGII